jgi:hypothetical protein
VCATQDPLQIKNKISHYSNIWSIAGAAHTINDFENKLNFHIGNDGFWDNSGKATFLMKGGGVFC